MRTLISLVLISFGLIGFLLKRSLEAQLPSSDLSKDSATIMSKNQFSESTNQTSHSNQDMIPFLPGIEIFTFDRDEPAWFTVDDNVMGGVSSSTVSFIDPDLMLFSGKMSLENNGGFSSVRSDWSPINLTAYDGVLIRVAGDGKAYRLRIQSETTGPEIAYNAIFETYPDSWQLVYIPFEQMIPTYRGFVMNVDRLDTEKIGSMGFMLSDKQAGDFELKVDWIRAVTEDEVPVLGSN